MADFKIGDEVYIHGFVDEIRRDIVIIKNEGGYFGTVTEEIIPSAQPEWKKGKWIISSKFDDCYYAKCDVCNIKQVFYGNKPVTNFCPNCGADMRGDKDDQR